MTPRPGQLGFTILEVMVALIIAATASAIILGHLRTLIDLSIRLRDHQREVTASLNEAAHLVAPGWGDGARAILGEDDIGISLRDSFSPSLFVSNFSLETEDLPPVDRAFTPYQLYRVQPGKRYAVTLLFPNLPPDL